MFQLFTGYSSWLNRVAAHTDQLFGSKSFAPWQRRTGLRPAALSRRAFLAKTLILVISTMRNDSSIVSACAQAIIEARSMFLVGSVVAGAWRCASSM